jgi:hypothetical protein
MDKGQKQGLSQDRINKQTKKKTEIRTDSRIVTRQNKRTVLFTPWIRDPGSRTGMIFFRIWDPGYRIPITSQSSIKIREIRGAEGRRLTNQSHQLYKELRW